MGPRAKSRPSVAGRLFTRILVPHDFSEHATRALQIAAGLAGPDGSLTVLHAVAPVYSSMGGPAADLAWTPTPEMVGDVGRELAALVARALEPSVATRVRTRVVMADPLTAILAAARGVDAIVMTTVGRTGLSHLLMGSVAEKVVRHATVPVLTIHPNTARRLAGPGRRRVASGGRRRRVSAR